jgi:hypothetical protein
MWNISNQFEMLRIGLIGFFESASFPAVFHFFPLWIGLDEKTVLVPFILSGMYVGEIIGFSLSGECGNGGNVIRPLKLI